MSVFSGRPNPEWQVPSKHPDYRKISEGLRTANNRRLVYCIDAMPAILGYRGFVVQEGKKAQLIFGRKTITLQKVLLKTMPKGLLPFTVHQDIQKMMTTGAVRADVSRLKCKRYAPVYDPTPWQGPNAAQPNRAQICNHCYNYANNRQTDDIAQPGGIMFKDRPELCNGPDVEAAAVSDGLAVLPTDPDQPVPHLPPNDPRHLVALAIWPGL